MRLIEQTNKHSEYLPTVNSVTPAFAAKATNLLVPSQYEFLLVNRSLTKDLIFEARFAVLGHLALNLAHLLLPQSFIFDLRLKLTSARLAT